MPPIIHLNDEDTLDLADYDDTGFRCGIFGSSGSGKGWLLGRIIEDVIEAGLPTIMLDPEGELWTFQEIGAVVIGGKHADAPFVESDDAFEEAINFALDTGTPIVFDVQPIAGEDQIEASRVGERIMHRLWAILDNDRRRAFFACTEAGIFAPETVDRGQRKPRIMRQMGAQGRKRGLDFVIETQRMAEIQNAVIGQCRPTFIGYVNKEFDFRPLRGEVAGRSFQHMRALPPGTFYSTHHDREIAIGPRKVTHGGGREEIQIKRPRSRRGVGSLVKSLQAAAQALPADAPEPPAPETDPGTGKRHPRDHVRVVPIPEWREVKAAAERVPDLERDLAAARDEAMTEQRRADQAEASAEAWRADAERFDRLRTILADTLQGTEPMTAQILMPDGTTAETFNTGSVTEDRVRELIREHGVDGAAPLAPVEHLRAKFLEDAADRLVAKVEETDERQRQALLFLLSDVKYRAAGAVSQAISGRSGGGTQQSWKTALDGLVTIGLVEKGGTGRSEYRAAVEPWLRRELGPHDPSEEDIASVRDRALSLLMS